MTTYYGFIPKIHVFFYMYNFMEARFIISDETLKAEFVEWRQLVNR